MKTVVPPKTSAPPPADDTRSIGGGTEKGALSGPQPICLLVSSRDGVFVVALADKKEFVIGRGRECDVFIDDASVSRRHAILRLGERITLEDLESSNGTVVGERKLAPGESVTIHVGAVFELGQTTIVLQRGGGFAPAPRRPEAAASGPVIKNDAMKRLYGLLDLIAPTPLAVLILGETGSGKEIFAEQIHRRSARADEPFLQLNCAAFPESILEGELFGSEKGAFTGAVQKAGLFESANGGTVFLDEIGEIPLGTQAKLLRVLESGEVMRLGARRSIKVDVRFVSATNRALPSMVSEGRFRPDLFYRLNGTTIQLPPLRKRVDEVVPLAEMFIKRAAAKVGKRPPTLGDEAKAELERYHWPGNIRELKNVIDRATMMCQGRELTAAHLEISGEGHEAVQMPSYDAMATGQHRVDAVPPPRASAPQFAATEPGTRRTSTTSLSARVEAMEKEAILDALTKTAGNQTKAAKLLGISRRRLVYRLEQFGITRPRKGLEHLGDAADEETGETEDKEGKEPK